MSDWLWSIVSSLYSLGDGSASSGKKLFSAVIVSVILYKLMQTGRSYTLIKIGGTEHFKMGHLTTLLEMLVLNPNVEKKECTEYDFLLGMLSEQRLVHHSLSFSIYCSVH